MDVSGAANQKIQSKSRLISKPSCAKLYCYLLYILNRRSGVETLCEEVLDDQYKVILNLDGTYLLHLHSGENGGVKCVAA